MTKGKYLPLAPAVLALMLGACGSNEQPTYEAEQSDMVVEDPSASSVPVNLPDTPMTNAPASEAAPAKPK